MGSDFDVEKEASSSYQETDKKLPTELDDVSPPNFEDAIVTNSELPAPTPGISRTWSSGSYPRLSEFMSLWPEVAIFRRFSALNTQNLLFLQAEIAHLERELTTIREREERRADVKGILAQRSWFELSQASEDGEDCPQWAVIQELRSKLTEYSMFGAFLGKILHLAIDFNK